MISELIAIEAVVARETGINWACYILSINDFVLEIKSQSKLIHIQRIQLGIDSLLIRVMRKKQKPSEA